MTRPSDLSHVTPPRYIPLLDGERLSVYLTMPKLDGHVVSLFHTPRAKLAAYEKQWGAWFRTAPKDLWPDWAERWIESRRTERKAE